MIDQTTDAQLPNEEAPIDIKRLLFKYLSYWKWFVAAVATCLAIGAVYLFFTPKQYDITASVLIKNDKAGGSGGINILEELDLFGSQKNIDNEIEIIHSYTLMEDVVRQLNLQVSYSIRKGLRHHILYEESPVKIELVTEGENTYDAPLEVYLQGEHLIIDGQRYPHEALITNARYGSLRTSVNTELASTWDPNTCLTVHIAPFKATVEWIRNSINVSTAKKGSAVINLSLRSPKPQRGMDILNCLIAAYNKAAIADKNALAGATINFIDDRLQLISADLESAEKKVENYKTEEHITDIGAESQLFLQSVQTNDLELSTVAIQLDILHQIEAYVLSSQQSSVPATLGISDPTLLALIGQLTAAETERAKALHTMKPANPMVQALTDEISHLKRNILDNIKTLRSSLQIKDNKLKEENLRLERFIRSVPRKERELVDVTRQKEIKNQLYVYLLSKREETAIAYAATVPDSRIIDAARSSLGPVAPRGKFILAGLFLLGLCIPVGILYIKDFFNDKLNSKSELNRLLKVPVVGEIALLAQANKLISARGIDKRYVEDLRTLRTNISFMQAGGGVKTILVTSSISGEGKSLLSANLGIAFASLGKKAIVLGFDLRKPGLHKAFGINNEKGLSDYLAGQASLPQVIRPVEEVEGLDIITCGHIAPNPQELLQGALLPQLFKSLQLQYDYIIVDTPPIGLVSDAAILDHYADVSLYVVRQNYTSKDQVTGINDLHAEKKLTNLGVVVNGVEREKWLGYYTAYYAYKYYGKYYGKYYEETAQE